MFRTKRWTRAGVAVLLAALVGAVTRAVADDPFANENKAKAIAVSIAARPASGALSWGHTLSQALAEAQAKGRLVFVDFTGKDCVNCRVNEKAVFTRPDVKALLGRYMLLRLYTDVVPDAEYPPAESALFHGSTTRQEADAAANQKFMAERFGTAELPLYAVLRPLPGGTFAEVARYTKGRIADVTEFERFLSNPLAGKPSPPEADRGSDLLRFVTTVEPKEARRGELVRLTIRGTPKSGYHTYPITQRSDDPAQSPSGLSRIIFEDNAGLRPLWPVRESDPDFVADKAGGVFLEHDRPFTWSQDVYVASDARQGPTTFRFQVRYLVCNERGCVPGTQRMEASFSVGGAPPVDPSPELKARLAAAPTPPKVVRVPEQLRGKMTREEEPPAVAGSGSPETSGTPAAPSPPVGLGQQLFFAALAGLAMLLTPCVFPMIPVTVSFFLKQGEKKGHNALALATVYSGTIVIVLTAAVLVLGNLIVSLANNVWLNLGMGAVLLFFALSLFGMFEIELPLFLTRFTSSHEGQGYVGAFFMALTFTINSFTCTGPFLGPLLSGVKELRLSFWEVAISALAYSGAFAAPFFLLALFPRLMKALPRSGGWLNGVKVVMGFVEVALALKFLSITDAGLHPGNPRFFNYETVLCVWMALSLACGLYLLGVFRLPHDTPFDHVGVPRLLLATFFIGLMVYMAPLLWRKTPQGAVGEFLVAWLPQDIESAAGAGTGGPGESPAKLDWSRDYAAAWERARSEGKMLFVDFTGINCQNCRFNEKNVFPVPEVRSEMSRFVRVQLYTDSVPEKGLSEDQAVALALKYREWQAKTFDDITLPLYAVIDPAGADRPVSDDGRLLGTVRGLAKGTIEDVPGFVDTLRKAQRQQVAKGR